MNRRMRTRRGERVRMGVGELCEPDILSLFQRPLLRLGSRRASGGEKGKGHVLRDRLLGQQLIELLEHHHAIRPGAPHLAVFETDRTLHRVHEAAHALEKRRLAASGRTEQHEPVAAVHVEAHAVRGRDEMFRVLYCSVTPCTCSSGVSSAGRVALQAAHSRTNFCNSGKKTSCQRAVLDCSRLVANMKSEIFVRLSGAMVKPVTYGSCSCRAISSSGALSLVARL